MMNKLIELKNLTKNFDDQQVLRGGREKLKNAWHSDWHLL